MPYWTNQTISTQNKYRNYNNMQNRSSYTNRNFEYHAKSHIHYLRIDDNRNFNSRNNTYNYFNNKIGNNLTQMYYSRSNYYMLNICVHCNKTNHTYGRCPNISIINNRNHIWVEKVKSTNVQGSIKY